MSDPNSHEVQPPATLEVDQRWEGIEGWKGESVFQLKQRWPERGGWRVVELLNGHLNPHNHTHFLLTDEEIRRCRYIGMAPDHERLAKKPPPPPTKATLPPVEDYSETSGHGRWVTILLVIVALGGGAWLLFGQKDAPPPARRGSAERSVTIDGQRYRCVPVEGE